MPNCFRSSIQEEESKHLAQRQKSGCYFTIPCLGWPGKAVPEGLTGRRGEAPDWPQLIDSELLCTFTKADKYSCIGCALHKIIWVGLNSPSLDFGSANQRGIFYFSQRHCMG